MKRISGPYGVFISLLAEKQLAFEGKFLFHCILGDQRIEIGLVFSGLGPQDPAQTLGLFLSGAEGARYLNGHGGIKAGTKKPILKTNEIDPDSNIFYDAVVLLSTRGVNHTQKPVRVVGYTANNVKYWVATSRHDLTAEQIALIYKLRWDIEIFLAGGNATSGYII